VDPADSQSAASDRRAAAASCSGAWRRQCVAGSDAGLQVGAGVFGVLVVNRGQGMRVCK